MRLSLLIFLALQAACASTTIIRDRDYSSASEAYQRTDAAAALQELPTGEANGFITSVERGWLSQWSGQWNPDLLQKQVDTFDQRRYISVTREAGVFLFQESEEGYVPSEYEVIVLHLVSAVHFAQKNQPEEAQVELRRAGYVLDRFWDDPALRLWLGALWVSLGHWDEAQVDFRRAAQISGDKRLLTLSERAKPPPTLSLHFYGNGPRLAWKEGHYEPEFLDDPGRPMNMEIAQPTVAWFKRHKLRNSELRDLLVKSNFMAQYLGSKSLTYAEHGLVQTTSWTVRALGVVLGAAIVAGGVYLVAQAGASGGGEVLSLIGAAGLAAGGVMWAAGKDMDRDFTRGIKAHDRKNQEDLRIYRMVRFMPTWIALDPAPSSTQANTASISLGKGVALINHF